MAFSGNFMCTSFKKELMEGVHSFKSSGGSTFNLAMYTNSASFTAAQTAYTSGNEVSGTNYTAKGVALTRIDPASSGTTAFTQFSNAVFSNVTLTAVRGALVFNDTASGDPTVCVLDFGGDKAASAGDFTVVMPTNNSSNALIRIA
jgi:PKD repeat protein